MRWLSARATSLSYKPVRGLRDILSGMKLRTVVVSVLFGCGSAAPAAPATPRTPATAAVNAGPSAPVRPPYDPVTQELGPPRDYRSWVYLTSGFNMGYGPAAVEARAGGVGSYDTVFVDPAAHAEFVKTGAWPDHTMFVLEIRSSEHSGSIVTTGHFQTDILGIEAEIKDRRIAGGWGFFSFPSDDRGPTGPTKRHPETAACYECHAVNAAVENTFTQFYPTLLPVAQAHGTVRKDFVGIPPSVDEIRAEIVAGGYAAARPRIDAALAKWPDAVIGKEVSLNRLGYKLAADKHVADAIEVLADVTRRFPRSANAWDSLAEVLEGAGKLAEARDATRRGLAVIDQVPPGSRRDALGKSLRDRAARLAK